MYGIDTNAKKITQSELVDIVRGLESKGMVPISLTRITKFQTRKPADYTKFELAGYSGKGGETWFAKVNQVNGNIGIVYEDKVNREREKQGLDKDFEAKATSYEYINKSLRKKGDQYYLVFFPLASAAKFDDVIVGCKNGEFENVLKESISDIIPDKSYTTSRQGLDEGTEVRYETISLGSIAAVRLDGVSYIVTDIDKPRQEAFNIAFKDEEDIT